MFASTCDNLKVKIVIFSFNVLDPYEYGISRWKLCNILNFFFLLSWPKFVTLSKWNNLCNTICLSKSYDSFSILETSCFYMFSIYFHLSYEGNCRTGQKWRFLGKRDVIRGFRFLLDQADFWLIFRRVQTKHGFGRRRQMTLWTSRMKQGTRRRRRTTSPRWWRPGTWTGTCWSN